MAIKRTVFAKRLETYKKNNEAKSCGMYNTSRKQKLKKKQNFCQR